MILPTTNGQNMIEIRILHCGINFAMFRAKFRAGWGNNNPGLS